MILRNKKRKDFEEKEEQYFIKTTTLKFLKKKKNSTILCVPIFIYNIVICWLPIMTLLYYLHFLLSHSVSVIKNKINTTQDGRNSEDIYYICLKKNSFLLLSDVINFVVFNHRSMYVFDKNFLRQEKEVK